jgi:hypothetical protein
MIVTFTPQNYWIVSRCQFIWDISVSILTRLRAELKGRAIAQAVSRRLPPAATRVRAGVMLCGISCGQSDIGARFLLALRFPLQILIPPTAPRSSSIIRGWYNRPVSGRRTKWTQSHTTPGKNRRNSCRDKRFVLLHSVLTGSGYYPVDIGATVREEKRPRRESYHHHHHHLVQRLRMLGAVPPSHHCLHRIMLLKRKDNFNFCHDSLLFYQFMEIVNVSELIIHKI